MPILVLTRHAKSDWTTGQADHRRPLNDRGRRSAPGIGRWLAETVGRLDVVAVSDATRAQQTWALASEHVAAGQVVSEPRIYEASAATLLDVARGFGRQLSPGVTSAQTSPAVGMLVGHNPGMELFAHLLVQEHRGELWDQLWEKFPTAATAVLDFDGSWSDLAPASARLVGFHVSRG